LNKLGTLIFAKNDVNKKLIIKAVEDTGLANVLHITANEDIAFEHLSTSAIEIVLFAEIIPKKATLLTIEKMKEALPSLNIVLAVPMDNKTNMLKQLIKETCIFDYIWLPSDSNSENYSTSIRNQLHGIFTQIITTKYTSYSKTSIPHQARKEVMLQSQGESAKVPPSKRLAPVDLILIASSTGGPHALEKIIKSLPAAFNKPILVVQHIPIRFTKNLANSLNKTSALPVLEAGDGDIVKAGQILIAPGGSHLTLANHHGRKVVKLTSSPPINGVKPSADVLFKSAASTYIGQNILAVILTGMGADGKEGIKDMKILCNCFCLVQSEKTCAVFGMPKSVIKAGLADQVEDLGNIGRVIKNFALGRDQIN